MALLSGTGTEGEEPSLELSSFSQGRGAQILAGTGHVPAESHQLLSNCPKLRTAQTSPAAVTSAGSTQVQLLLPHITHGAATPETFQQHFLTW